MIKDVKGFENILNNYDSKSWAKSAEVGWSNLPGVDEGNGIQSDGNKTFKSFGDFLSESVMKVNEIQHDANIQMQKLASGESKSIHETLLAVEKADLAFRQMNQIRTKVVEAYKEVMKMQI